MHIPFSGWIVIIGVDFATTLIYALMGLWMWRACRESPAMEDEECDERWSQRQHTDVYPT